MPFLQTNGFRIHYQEWAGPDAGVPVVLIHGLSGRAVSWSEVGRALAARGFHVIAPDVRGHGDSDKSEEYRIEGYVGDVVDLIQDLELRPAHLVGHSLGGAVAWEVAAARPDLVRRLVIEDQHPNADPDAWKADQEVFASWPRQFASREEGIEFLRAGGRTVAWWEPSLVRQPDGGWGWTFDFNALIETKRHLYEQPRWEGLRRVQATTLVIRGGRSAHLRPEDAERMVRTIAAARLLTLPDADHWVHRHAAPYVEAVAHFLREEETTEPGPAGEIPA